MVQTEDCLRTVDFLSPWLLDESMPPFLLVGPDGCGKRLVALYFGLHLLLNFLPSLEGTKIKFYSTGLNFEYLHLFPETRDYNLNLHLFFP